MNVDFATYELQFHDFFSSFRLTSFKYRRETFAQ